MNRSVLVERLLLLLLAGLLAAIGIVLLSTQRSQGSGSSHSGTFAGPTMPPNVRAADFSLKDQDGRSVSLSRYRGRVVVLTFIHSQCHDACPLMVEQIKGALRDLPGSFQGLPVIGITVAPGEDTAASRKRFLAQHQMTGRLSFLGGSRAQLARVWRAYAIQPVTPKIDHSTFVLLIDKRGMERVGFPVDQLTPEGLAHDLRVLERERSV